MVLNVLPPEDHSDDHGGCSAGEPCGTGLEKIYPTTAVRYGAMRYIGEFRYPEGMTFGCGVKVVIQTKRGTEIGEQVSLTCTGCDKSVSREQILAFTARSGPSYYELGSGRILRIASPDDVAEYDHIRNEDTTKRKLCQRLARERSLDLKVVTCEQLLGGERIIFYFMAEGRIDFRDLVKDLAHEFQTRIEMRQVGARDEARLVADFETCGRECCCKTFLKSLKGVNMKMAKLQKATLDPSKVSGRCGRLKCCLRYEHTGYEELDRRLPRVGVRVRTAHGNGRVVARQILTQLLQVEIDEKGVVAIGIEDVLTGDAPAPVAALPTAAPAVTQSEPAASSDVPTAQPTAEPKPDARPRTDGGRPRSDGSRPRRRGDERGTKRPTPPAEPVSAESTDSTQPSVPKKRRARKRRRGRGRPRTGDDSQPNQEGQGPPPGDPPQGPDLPDP